MLLCKGYRPKGPEEIRRSASAGPEAETIETSPKKKIAVHRLFLMGDPPDFLQRLFRVHPDLEIPVRQGFPESFDRFARSKFHQRQYGGAPDFRALILQRLLKRGQAFFQFVLAEFGGTERSGIPPRPLL
jgi:hypothetical protein